MTNENTVRDAIKKLARKFCAQENEIWEEASLLSRRRWFSEARADLHDAQAKRIAELEAKNRELHMQVIASDSQAQMAYEEQGRLEELEGQLKMVLDRESATHLRHDAKTDKLEALIVELEAKLARVIEIANLIAGRMMR